MHPLQRRYLAEDLVRLRRSDEQRRYVAPQRAGAGKIDPNPHQIEAVMFALSRHREGGCILADEVGLGKTIEAGLVMAQLFAEGATRVLLIAPKALLGQWRDELYRLFELPTREGVVTRKDGFDGPGVFLVGREAAGGERGHAVLMDAEAFDLCVIDEAHEVFAGIHKRFDAFGAEKADSTAAQTAARVRAMLQKHATPALLLTATPIQNSLAELWGLVQFVDPEGTLLGDLATFRELFCGQDDRQLARGQEGELRARLRTVMKRTLRRQAQEFLDRPFVQRHARQFDYRMGPRERELYDDVTRYLLEPGIVAFQGNHRQLLLLGFHRRLASSTRALARSLARVAARLRRLVSAPEGAALEDARALYGDDDDDDDDDANHDAGALPGPEDDPASKAPAPEPARVRAELARVEGFVARAEALAHEDSKLRALLQALTFVTTRARAGQGSGKIVLFTEFVSTQEYLRERLLESGLVTEGELTLFRGTNTGPRASEALARWQDEVPQDEGARPSKSMAVRLALVHEFRTRTRVFISTEAGAKGLNLQFCETVVNYDLPWNPQRIEQRIGRCHRYGQRHEVTVVSFLARDNEAELLMFEILSQKLNLFGAVLDASDHVLHRPDELSSEALVGVLGADVEAALRRIWDRARTTDEVVLELRALRAKVEERRKLFEETHARTRGVIEQRLDVEVRRAFRERKDELPQALAELDRDLLRTVLGYLEARSIPYTEEVAAGGQLLHVAASSALPEGLRAGVTAAIGAFGEHRALCLTHPLVIAAVDEARAATSAGTGTRRVCLRLPPPPVCTPAEALTLRGASGRLRILQMAYEGFERVERLVPVVVLAGAHGPLPPALAEALLGGEITDAPAASGGPCAVDEATMDEAAEELTFALQPTIDAAEHPRYERAVLQNERWVEDRIHVVRRRQDALATRLAAVEGRRDAALGSERRTELEAEVAAAERALEQETSRARALERREDPQFQRRRERLHEQRYARPRGATLFDVEIVIT